jgi:hypothetical protein
MNRDTKGRFRLKPRGRQTLNGGHWISTIKRRRIYERDGGRCVYCGEKLTPDDRSLDHVLPRPKGSNAAENLVTACMRCNALKDRYDSAIEFCYTEFGDRAPEVLSRMVEAMARPLAKTKPRKGTKRQCS